MSKGGDLEAEQQRRERLVDGILLSEYDSKFSSTLKHGDDFSLGQEHRDLSIMLRQSHIELVKQLDGRFSSLREEILGAISELYKDTSPPRSSNAVQEQKGVMAEHHSLGNHTSGQTAAFDAFVKETKDVLPANCEGNSLKSSLVEVAKSKQSTNSNGETLQSLVPAVSESGQGIAKQSTPSDLEGRNRSSTVCMSELNIYDPADSVKCTQTGKTPGSFGNRMSTTMKRWQVRLEGQGFDMLIGVLIIANALVMSIELEYQGAITASILGLPVDTKDWPGAKVGFLVLAHFFTIIFVLEVIARICMWGLQYYRSATNFLDFGIVAISVLDLYVLPWAGRSLPNVSFLRLLRIMKLARVLRIVRVFKVFRHLRVLINSTISSIGALMWSMIFLALIQLITSILITQSVQNFLRNSDNDLETRMFIYDRFGTFLRSIITLFEMTLAPGAWAKVGRVLIYEVNAVYVLFFSMYVPVVTFGITRVMTALFLRETLAAASGDKDMIVEEKLRNKRATKENLKALYDKIDIDGSGQITVEELQSALLDPRSAMWLQILDVSAYDVGQLFELLDKDNDGYITFDEFSAGIVRLKGGAKSIDVISVLHQNQEMFEAIQALSQAAGIRPLPTQVASGDPVVQAPHKLFPIDDPVTYSEAAQARAAPPAIQPPWRSDDYKYVDI